MPDEDAILSIDFLAGFTVFILALIMVISLVPGILAGIQSENIDYDAVAYRTSVILVEDPGAPDNPPWNLMGTYDMAHKDDIQRLGLAVSKDTPNILSREKVDKFFNNINDSDFKFTADDYRDKVIFGDIPYLYNISLKLDTDNDPYYADGGTEVPEFQYGYMRRLVKVKEPSVAEINLTRLGPYSGVLDNDTLSTSADFAVLIPYDVLINRSVNSAYRIEPQSEQLMINLTEMLPFLNNTDGDIESMNFTSMVLYKQLDDGSTVLIPDMYPFDNDTYSLTFDGTPVPAIPDSPEPISNSSVITMVLYPPLPFSNEITSSLNVNFNFSYVYASNMTDHSYLTGLYQYDYTTNVTQPKLEDAVMEVAIW